MMDSVERKVNIVCWDSDRSSGPTVYLPVIFVSGLKFECTTHFRKKEDAIYAGRKISETLDAELEITDL